MPAQRPAQKFWFSSEALPGETDTYCRRVVSYVAQDVGRDIRLSPHNWLQKTNVWQRKANPGGNPPLHPAHDPAPLCRGAAFIRACILKRPRPQPLHKGRGNSGRALKETLPPTGLNAWQRRAAGYSARHPGTLAHIYLCVFWQWGQFASSRAFHAPRSLSTVRPEAPVWPRAKCSGPYCRLRNTAADKGQQTEAYCEQ